jgi:transcription elongation factor GreB
VSEAAALGDRSENAEYIYGKKALRELDRRVRYLSKRLDEVQVVDRTPGSEAGIRFGATVQLRGASDTKRTLRIVGYDEIDPARHWISIDAPVARALLGKHPGDTLALPGPSGPERWTVEAFTYDEP